MQLNRPLALTAVLALALAGCGSAQEGGADRAKSAKTGTASERAAVPTECVQKWDETQDSLVLAGDRDWAANQGGFIAQLGQSNSAPVTVTNALYADAPVLVTGLADEEHVTDADLAPTTGGFILRTVVEDPAEIDINLQSVERLSLILNDGTVAWTVDAEGASYPLRAIGDVLPTVPDGFESEAGDVAFRDLATGNIVEDPRPDPTWLPVETEQAEPTDPRVLTDAKTKWVMDEKDGYDLDGEPVTLPGRLEDPEYNGRRYYTDQWALVTEADMIGDESGYDEAHLTLTGARLDGSDEWTKTVVANSDNSVAVCGDLVYIAHDNQIVILDQNQGGETVGELGSTNPEHEASFYRLANQVPGVVAVSFDSSEQTYLFAPRG